MDFELKTLRLPEAAAYSSPALAVLVADGFEPGEDALSALIQRALASGDFKTEAGALLSSFGAPRVTSERLLLVGIGNGSPTQVRKAVAAAVGHCKRSPASALTLCFAAATSPAIASSFVVTSLLSVVTASDTALAVARSLVAA